MNNINHIATLGGVNIELTIILVLLTGVLSSTVLQLFTLKLVYELLKVIWNSLFV